MAKCLSQGDAPVVVVRVSFRAQTSTHRRQKCSTFNRAAEEEKAGREVGEIGKEGEREQKEGGGVGLLQETGGGQGENIIVALGVGGRVVGRRFWRTAGSLEI